MRELPTTELIDKKKWSVIYAYKLKTLRDIFVYCCQKGSIKKEQLYNDMASNIIPPPKGPWINYKRKRSERNRLEYIHAAEYLGFIKRKQEIIIPDFDYFKKEKKIIIEANKDRIFKPSTVTVNLKESEKEALVNILFDYGRARDYFHWFLDFKKYPNAKKFKLVDFRKDGKPIFLLGKTIADKKGTNILKRSVDCKLWKIPDDYIRLTNSLFPAWFIELGLIDKVSIFPDFSEDKEFWRMFYPISRKNEEFLAEHFKEELLSLFLKDKKIVSIWIPQLIYILANKFCVSVSFLKDNLIKIYKADYSHFYLERTSLQVMRKHSRYVDSYIKIDGFYRSTLKIIQED